MTYYEEEKRAYLVSAIVFLVQDQPATVDGRTIMNAEGDVDIAGINDAIWERENVSAGCDGGLISGKQQVCTSR